MQRLNPEAAKTILSSKRANIFYLEYCRVTVKDGAIVYLKKRKGPVGMEAWNIPAANTSVVLLGPGTSISQAAVCEFSKAGTMMGFCGGGGLPLVAGSEYSDMTFLCPQNEYRLVAYMHAFARIFFNDKLRLEAAKRFQHARIKKTEELWIKNEFCADEVSEATARYRKDVEKCRNFQEIFEKEGQLVKTLYAFAARYAHIDNFVRNHQDGKDDANKFLTNGNYLAYGLAATTLWTLGISHALSVLHGKTRRGALVFDVADIIKDSIVLRMAFVGAKKGLSLTEFKTLIVEEFTSTKALDYLFNTVKQVAIEVGGGQEEELE